MNGQQNNAATRRRRNTQMKKSTVQKYEFVHYEATKDKRTNETKVSSIEKMQSDANRRFDADEPQSIRSIHSTASGWLVCYERKGLSHISWRRT